MSKHAAGEGRGESDQPAKLRRKRVVLADARAPVTVLRTAVELEEQTSYGEQLISDLIARQLRTAGRTFATVVIVFCAIPAVLFALPVLNQVAIAGVRLPWILLGVVPFPILFGAGYWNNVRAERNERDFVDLVEK